ncbi:hypothetical protein BX600DRAFT_442186 [Xylariales sp. PMI_506]|nr:hypothetical protein BX600DRAFT_442186 [Xylariales sp. PMI_506]
MTVRLPNSFKLAIAPNGKTFAGSDGSGAIKVYNFETLQFLHRIPIQHDPATAMTFTSDSLRILDVRTTQSNVWEPAVLVSQDTDSHSSKPSQSAHQAVDDLAVASVDQSSITTSLYCCEENGIAFCGRSNGRVDTCKVRRPRRKRCAPCIDTEAGSPASQT